MVIRAFLHNILDYAGMFPPAHLNLDDAFSNYMAYEKTGENWMLSRFICPAGKVKDLASHAALQALSGSEHVRLSVLAGTAPDAASFHAAFETAFSDLLPQSDTLKSRLYVESIELKIPDSLASNCNSQDLSLFLDGVSERVKERFSHRVFIFAELPLTGDFEQNMNTLIRAISIHNETFDDTGFKLRTGGTDPSDIPSPGAVVKAIRSCLDSGVRIKFTAGMHHPFRHFDNSLGCDMHGFINVFGAGILAYRHAISNHELKEVISDKKPGNFKFTEEYFEWKGWKCSNEEIHGARNGLVISFGSCSFDEPVQDLKSLKLI